MARGGTRRDQGKERFWRRLLRLQRRSDQTIRDFCAEHHVSEASFFAWRRTIAERDRQRGRRVEPNLETTGASRDAGSNSNAGTGVNAGSGDAPAGRLKMDGQPLFVPLRVVATSAAPSGPSVCESLSVFEVVLSSGRIVRVPVNFEAASLRQLLVVLEDVDNSTAEASTADEEQSCEERPC